MTTVNLVNAVDTYIDSGVPTKNFNTLKSFYVRTTAPYRYAFIYFALNIPKGATITSAKLYLRNGTAAAGTQRLDVVRVNRKYDARTITWNNAPGYTGTICQQTKTAPAAYTQWDVDVTPIIQAVADGAPWYGFRITGAASLWFYSTQYTNAAWRPKLVVTWSDAPDQPDVLSPGGGRAVSVAAPIVRTNFIDVSGDRTMQALQVQADALGDFGSSIDWDSGTVLADAPQLDLSTALGTLAAGTTGQAFPAVAADGSMYWRTRVQDGAGLWSPWSSATQWVRKLKGTIAFTNPPAGVLSDPTPPIAWTFSGNGRTQKAYEVFITTTDNPSVVLWTSGKTTSTATSTTVKTAVMKTPGSSYRIYIRIWDEISRESIAGDPAYTQAYVDVTYTPTATVTPVDSVTGTVLSPKPGMQLDFSRATGDPDSFVLLRDGNVIREYLPDEVRVSTGVYRLVDWTATARKDHTWAVACVVNGQQSSANPTYTGRVRMSSPWLMEPDGSNGIGFLNPAKDGSLWDGSTVFQPIGEGANPVMISQGVGGESGSFSGMLATESGVDVETMLASLKALRKKQGTTLLFHYINQVLEVIVNDIDYQAIAYPNGGVDYRVSFSYWQVNYQ